MTGEATSHHIPYGAFFHTKRCPRKASRCISATQYKAGEVVTGEAASRHIPYGAFFHTERYPRKASRCISATQYKAGKVVTGDTASCQKPSGAFLQTKCYPPEQKRIVLEDVGTAYLFYCHLTRDSWTLAFIRRMSQRDWMAFGSTWRFFHMWKHSVKLSTPRPTQSNWQKQVPLRQEQSNWQNLVPQSNPS